MSKTYNQEKINSQLTANGQKGKFYDNGSITDDYHEILKQNFSQTGIDDLCAIEMSDKVIKRLWKPFNQFWSDPEQHSASLEELLAAIAAEQKPSEDREPSDFEEATEEEEISQKNYFQEEFGGLNSEKEFFEKFFKAGYKYLRKMLNDNYVGELIGILKKHFQTKK